MGRILAIDYGRKRTGLAATDPAQIIANGLCTVETHRLWDYLCGYVAAEQVDRSGILAVLDVVGTIFHSYWFIVVLGLIILIMIIYVIAAKLHRKRVRARKKVKRYRNF